MAYGTQLRSGSGRAVAALLRRRATLRGRGRRRGSATGASRALLLVFFTRVSVPSLTFADEKPFPLPHPTRAYTQTTGPPPSGAPDCHPQEAQIKPLRGFDRLGAAGFSEDDILNFRRQFHSRSSADYIATAEFPTEEECVSPSPSSALPVRSCKLHHP